MTKEKQIEEMAKSVCHLDRTCDECMTSFKCKAMTYAKRFYNAGYRKADEVVEEIFKAFRAEIRSEIARNEELFAEDEDDFYEGRNDAYRTAINFLAELKKKYTEEKKDNG